MSSRRKLNSLCALRVFCASVVGEWREKLKHGGTEDTKVTPRKELRIWVCLLASFLSLFCAAQVQAQTGEPSANNAAVQFVSAEELKAKIAKNEPVTIIDVRATTGLLESDNKIKGSLHVKLRHLRSRLGYPPLKGVPHNREVVTYCACPNDESGIRAAQVLIDAGFSRVRVLKGGWVAWKKVNGPVEPFSHVM